MKTQLANSNFYYVFATAYIEKSLLKSTPNYLFFLHFTNIEFNTFLTHYFNKIKFMRTKLITYKFVLCLFAMLLLGYSSNCQTLPDTNKVTWKSSKEAEIALNNYEDNILPTSNISVQVASNYSDYFTQFIKILKSNIASSPDVKLSFEKAFEETRPFLQYTNANPDEFNEGIKKILEVLTL